MKPGDILLVNSKGFISWAIKKVTGSKYSHAMLVVNPRLAVDAMPVVGVRLINLDNFIKERDYYFFDIYRYHKELNPEQIKKINEFAMRKVGSKYDYGLILSLFLKIKNICCLILNKPEDWICSELVDSAFSSAGIDLLPDRTSSIGPHELSKSDLLIKIKHQKG